MHASPLTPREFLPGVKRLRLWQVKLGERKKKIRIAFQARVKGMYSFLPSGASGDAERLG